MSGVPKPRRDRNALVEKELKKVWLPAKQKYSVRLRNSPHIQDSNQGVIE